MHQSICNHKITNNARSEDFSPTPNPTVRTLQTQLENKASQIIPRQLERERCLAGAWGISMVEVGRNRRSRDMSKSKMMRFLTLSKTGLVSITVLDCMFVARNPRKRRAVNKQKRNICSVSHARSHADSILKLKKASMAVQSASNLWLYSPRRTSSGPGPWVLRTVSRDVSANKS